MDWLVANHDALEGLGGLSAVLGLLTVLFGGMFGYFRFLKDREQSYIQTARTQYYEYCRLSIDNAEYFGDYWIRSDLSAVQRLRYTRFVCFMINGVEDIFAADPDPAWHRALKEDFRPHVAFFCSPDFDRLRAYFFPATCRVIDEVISEEAVPIHA